MPTPAQTALIDQVNAANRRYRQAFRETAELINGHVTDESSPIGERLMHELGERLQRGITALCDHLSGETPVGATWMPWAPGLIRCLDCADRLSRRAKSDSTCDACGRHTRSLYPRAGLRPARAMESTGATSVRLLAIPSLMIVFSLCVRCDSADQQAIETG